jgi:oxygen-independent coproporphyrinogen-3 oxidase
LSAQLAGLYLHIPFCARVCPYCDFAVRTGDRERRRRFADHLLREIALYAGYPLRFDTIYFGGGTPSRLEPRELERIVVAARHHLQVADDSLVFLEANPEDVTPSRLADWRQLGVGTLSLGVQSLEPDALEFLGRRHGPDDARRAVAQAREAGFHTVSIDLIYGLPGQQASAWQHELERALTLGAHHFSCYQLTIHERTRFALLERRGQLTQPSSDEQAQLFRLTHELLNASGMQGYEVSQFATSPEHHSRHNMKYWNHIPYLGLGPSAHSFHDRRRWWNIRRTDPWQESVRAGRRPVDGAETLDTDALVLETLMTGLRTYAGVDLTRLRSRWGVDLLDANRPLVQRLESDGLLVLDDERLVPTLDGLALTDTVAAQFEIRSGLRSPGGTGSPDRSGTRGG